MRTRCQTCQNSVLAFTNPWQVARPFLSLLILAGVVFECNVFFANTASGARFTPQSDLWDGAQPDGVRLFVPPDNSHKAIDDPLRFKILATRAIPFDQSDWDLLNTEKGVVRIVLSGFARFNGGTPIEPVEVVDPMILADIGSRCFRNAVSDLGDEVTVHFSNSAIGRLELELSDGQRVRIGVTGHGFVLGYDQGTIRQEFFSPGLASSVSQCLPDPVAVKFLSGFADRVAGKGLSAEHQPDLVRVGDAFLLTKNPIQHPKSVSVPENVPFVLDSADGRVFASNLFCEGHWSGWSQRLRDYRSEVRGQRGSQDVNNVPNGDHEPRDFFKEGFVKGYRLAQSRLSSVERVLTKEQVLKFIDDLNDDAHGR